MHHDSEGRIVGIDAVAAEAVSLEVAASTQQVDEIAQAA
jgi:hypothetical protein